MFSFDGSGDVIFSGYNSSMKKKFFVHYNKPKSQQAGHMIMSVHCRQMCYFTRSVKINVPIRSRERKRQPRCVMEGYCTEIKVTKDEIVIS